MLDACCHTMADNGKTEKNGSTDLAVKTGVLGFEPRLSDSESLVLPLHHTPLSLLFTVCYAVIRRCNSAIFTGVAGLCNNGYHNLSFETAQYLYIFSKNNFLPFKKHPGFGDNLLDPDLATDIYFPKLSLRLCVNFTLKGPGNNIH